MYYSGSLWGAIRIGNPLPHDTDIDMGVMMSDIAKVPRAKLDAAFAAVRTAPVAICYFCKAIRSIDRSLNDVCSQTRDLVHSNKETYTHVNTDIHY
jgi:phosphorylcholine metabolism protein LicD